jgi:hypothetical protein
MGLLMDIRDWFRAMALSFLLLANAAGADLETQIKAAYLYKFCLYVDWPVSAFESPNSPITIGISRDRALSEELQRITGQRQVKDRSIEVRYIDSLEAFKGLHVLYVGSTTGDESKAVFAKVAMQPILTVIEEGPSGMPGIIEFVVNESRVKFNVKLNEAEQAGLHLSSDLLSVANVVVGANSRPR